MNALLLMLVLGTITPYKQAFTHKVTTSLLIYITQCFIFDGITHNIHTNGFSITLINIY